MRKILFCMLVFVSADAFSYTQDVGKVEEVFVTPTGSIALKLDKPYENAIASNQCPSNNGWAGHADADPVLKSAILAAKMSGVQVTVTIEGCLGSWFEIKDIYLK